MEVCWITLSQVASVSADLETMDIPHLIYEITGGYVLLATGGHTILVGRLRPEDRQAVQEEELMSWRTARSDGFSYSQVPASELAALVISATSSGCGISFGTTKDRGALIVTVFAGDSGKEITYARSPEDLSVLLSDLNSAEFMEWARKHQPV